MCKITGAAHACPQDILSRFNGSWALRPMRSEDGAPVVGTDAILEQDILPAGQALIARTPELQMHAAAPAMSLALPT